MAFTITANTSSGFDIGVTPVAVNLKINIGDVWKDVTLVQINVGDVWENDEAVLINV